MNRSKKIKSKICVLLEQKMTIADALKIFHLQDGSLGDLALIKKVYRILSLKNHPDRGGSDQKQSEINNAFDILKLTANTISNKDAIEKQKNERQAAQILQAKIIKEELLKRFDIDKFIKHLTTVSGVNFTGEITKIFPKEGRSGFIDGVGFQTEFISEDKTKTLGLDILVLSETIVVGGLSNKDATYDISVKTWALINNKNVIITKRAWSFSNDYSVLFNPEKAFPTNKIKKIFSQETSDKQLSKKDIELSIKKRFHGKRDEVTFNWEIPIGKLGNSITFERSVIKRKGFWTVAFVNFKDDKGDGPLNFHRVNGKEIKESDAVIDFLKIVTSKAKNMQGKKLVDFVVSELNKKGKTVFEAITPDKAEKVVDRINEFIC